MIRPLKGIEGAFANPMSQDNVFLSIKFTDSKYVQHAAENFKKIFSGLRLKIDNGHYYQLEDRETPISKLPNWIQDCKTANHYVYNHQMKHYTKSLASLSANDSILVVNSSHALSDGGFMVKALSQCLDDFSHEKVNNSPPLITNDAFKNELEIAEKNFDKRDVWPMSELSSCMYDTNDSHLASPGTNFIENEECIPVDQLACYNKNTKRPQNLSDISCVGVAMSILALNKINNNVDFDYNQHLSLTVILDVRRFVQNKSNLNWTVGNCIAQPAIKAKVSKSDTIENVAKKIRDDIKFLNPHGALYCSGHMRELLNRPSKAIVGCHSGIGPIKFKRPIIDFDLRDCIRLTPGTGGHGEDSGVLFGIISYSKVNEYRNDFCYLSRVWPSKITLENANILFNSFKHFITKIPTNARFDETLKELIDFQKSVKRNY